MSYDTLILRIQGFGPNETLGFHLADDVSCGDDYSYHSSLRLYWQIEGTCTRIFYPVREGNYCYLKLYHDIGSELARFLAQTYGKLARLSAGTTQPYLHFKIPVCICTFSICKIKTIDLTGVDSTYCESNAIPFQRCLFEELVAFTTLFLWTSFCR